MAPGAAAHFDKPGLTPAEASDVLWLLTDADVYHRLVIEQDWPPARYQQ